MVLLTKIDLDIKYYIIIMENFDFNIDNYSVKNMEDFLNLPYGNYTEIEINEKVQTMKDTLLKSKESVKI